jgi:hypothetical protein
MEDDDFIAALAYQNELECRSYREDILLKQARAYSGFRAECDRFSADFKKLQQELNYERYQFNELRPTRTEQLEISLKG